MKLLLTLLLLCWKLRTYQCSEKFWTGVVDWDDPKNWLYGQAPQVNSRIIFPLEMRHAVGMPPRIDQMDLKGLELPRDGIVALPENGKILVSPSSGRINRARWLRTAPFFWVDPDNWRAESEAVPHLERLPCQSDVVVLPASSRTFSAKLPVSRDVEVRAVRRQDENATLARWQWKDMKDNAEFTGSPFSVGYSPLMGCQNCPCQEGDISEYWEEICDVQRPKCGLPACEYPLKVEGHCCHYCGGRIRLSKKSRLSSAERVARNALADYGDALAWYSRQTSDGQGEILIVERGGYSGDDVVFGIAQVEAALRESNIKVVSSETSGGPLFDHRLLMALGPFFGGFFVLLLLLLLLFAAFGYTYSQMWDGVRELGSAIFTDRRVNGYKRKSFAFARFENLMEGNVQLTEEEQEERAGEHSSQGERFENPLYKHERGKKLDAEEPVSLIGLEKALELDDNSTEDIEMDIENL